MPKVATETRTVRGLDEFGNVAEIEIAIPVGEPQKPTQRAELIMTTLQQSNWKEETLPFYTTDKQLANEIRECLEFYHGGCEMESIRIGQTEGWRVQSRGYYHYVGA